MASVNVFCLTIGTCLTNISEALEVPLPSDFSTNRQLIEAVI